jgi:hypothetical protein
VTHPSLRHLGNPIRRRFGCPEGFGGVQVGWGVSKVMVAFVASLVGYLGVVLPSRMALLDPESTPPAF